MYVCVCVCLSVSLCIICELLKIGTAFLVYRYFILIWASRSLGQGQGQMHKCHIFLSFTYIHACIELKMLKTSMLFEGQVQGQSKWNGFCFNCLCFCYLGVMEMVRLWLKGILVIDNIVGALCSDTSYWFCAHWKDYLSNGQLHIAPNGHKVISLSQAQSTKFVSLLLSINLVICHISHTAVIFGTETFWCNWCY